MARLKQIQKEEVKFVDFPTRKDFHYQSDNYLLEFSKADEIRMSYYVRDVKVFKNQKLIKSGDTEDPDYLVLTSLDNRFLFIPFRNSFEICDLQSGKSFSEDVAFIQGNHFDQTSTFLLLIGFEEYKLISLENKKVVKSEKRERFFSQAHFGKDNTVWTIQKFNDIQVLEKLNPNNLKIQTEPIASPFEFFDIDKRKYQKLINLNRHCLSIKEGGMLHSSLLDTWQYIKTELGSVYKAVIPVSDIKYSENYRTDFCSIDYYYVLVEE